MKEGIFVANDTALFKTLEAIFIGTHQSLYAMAYNFVLDAEVAKEIVQRAFLKLHDFEKRRSGDFDPADFLKQSIYNESYRHLKHPARTRNAPVPLAGTPGQRSAITDKEVEVRNAIGKLSPKTRMVFLLSRQEHLDYGQIALILNLSEKSVANEMAAALRQILLH